MLQFILTLTDESNHSKVERIYNKYHNYIMKCAITKFKSLGRADYMIDAEDAVQNTFIKIVRYIDSFDFSRGEKDIKNYCLAILSNEIRSILKENEKFYEKSEEFFQKDKYNIIEELEIQERYNEVVSAIEALDFKYCTTLQLYYCEEMTTDEIAEIMGISTKTVYTRLARGRKILLESLKGKESNG